VKHFATTLHIDNFNFRTIHCSQNMIDMSETVHIRVACRVFAAKNTEIKKKKTINIHALTLWTR
jgi:hypothetical protein